MFCSRKCYLHDTDFKYRKKTPGGYRQNSGIGKFSWYTSPIAGKVFLQSTYELRYAKYLDKTKTNWKKNKRSFHYVYENKSSKYFPDFYLPDLDEYHEVKGFIRPNDRAKWSQFPKSLKIIFKKDLEKLENSLDPIV